MSDLFFIVASSPVAREHMQASLIDGVPLTRLGPLADDPAVRAAARDGRAFLWGAQAGPQNETRWRRMAPGDVGVVYSQAHFLLWSRVVAKRHDPELAARIWEPDDKGPWEYTYVVERPRAMQLPARVLFTAIGYQQEFPRGFSYPAEAAQQLIRDRYGSPAQLIDTLERNVLGVIPTETPDAGEPLTTPYRPADETATVAQAEPTAPDPAKTSAAVAEHARIQNALAARAQELGYECLSPGPLDPDFDIAWRLPDQRLVVAEVKTLTPQNERVQLRRGLGQLLEYRHRLRSAGEGVTGVLAVSREPFDGMWHSLLSELGIFLVWPGALGALNVAEATP